MSPLILNVDDNDAIRYVRSRTLTQAGYRLVEASSGEDALLMAATLRPRLIVLDIELPGIDGLEVCRRIKADPATAHMMVLQVSAARSDRLDRVAGLEGGADAYLIEPIDGLELVATVRALLRLADREAENLRLIRRLSRTERQFVEATEAADCGLWDWDIPIGKLEWFGAHERLAGIAPGSFSGKIDVFLQILHPDDRERVWRTMHEAMARHDDRFADEYRFVHPDGSVHWMEGTGRFFYDAQGQALRMTGVVRDITARKQAEERLRTKAERSRLLARAAEQLLTSDDPSGLMTGVFETVRHHLELDGFFHYRVDESRSVLRLEACAGVPDHLLPECQHLDFGRALCGTTAALRQPMVRERLQDSHDEAAQSVKALGFRAYACHPLLVGERLLGTLSFASKGRDRFALNEIEFMATICRYVAAAMERLRLQQEAVERAGQLAKSEDTLQRAQRAAKAGVWDIDLIEDRVTWSDSYYDLYGLARTIRPSHEAWIESIHPDDRARVDEAFRRTVAGKGDLSIEFRVLRPDGAVCWLHSQGEVLCDETGRAARVAGITYDITERKRAEQALHESEERLRILVNGVRDYAVFMLDLDGKVISWNAGAERVVGYRADEILGRDHSVFYTEEAAAAGQPARDLRAAAAAAAAAAAYGRYEQDEWRVRKDGSRFLSNTIVTALRNEDQTLRGFAVVMRDVTERKAREQAMVEQARLLDLSNDAIIVRDEDDRIRYWNHGASELYGWSDDEAIGKLSHELLRTEYPKPLEHILAELHRDGRWQGELIHTSRDGRPITVVSRWALDRDGDGFPIAILETNNDITERKEAEAALEAMAREADRRAQEAEESRRLLMALMEYIPEGITIADAPDVTIRYVSKYGRTLVQRDERDIAHIPVQEHAQKWGILRADGRTPARNEELPLTRATQRGEVVIDEEWVLRRADGSMISLLCNAGPIRDTDGRIIGGVIVWRDITSRKRADLMLRLERERLALALEAGQMGVYELDMVEDRLWWSPEIYRVFGVSPDAFTPTRDAFTALVHPDDRDVFWRRLEDTIGRQQEFVHEFRIVRPDGAVRWIGNRAQTVCDAAGRPLRHYGVAVDMTERKQAEERLLRSEERMQLAMKTAAAATWDVDLVNDKIYWSDSHFTLLGYEPTPTREATTEMWQGAVLPEDLDRLLLEWQRAEQGRDMFQSEHRLRRADTGEIIWVRASGRFFYDSRGEAVRFIGVFFDITERKRQEEELRRWKEELEVRVEERTQELLASQERLRELASQLTMAEQRERQKLARDLHDYLAQMLVVGRMKMNAAKRQPGLSSASATMLHDVDTIFQQALSYTRTLIGELSPPSFRDYGLPAALKWLSERMQKDGLWVEVQADREQVPLTEERAVLVFQCVRELLFNVLKHAAVDRATVRVAVDDQGEVRVSVEDRGKGLDRDALRRAAEPGHLGLFAVRERMESLGGSLDVASAPGQGTTVTLSVPGGGSGAEQERAEGRVRASEAES